MMEPQTAMQKTKKTNCTLEAHTILKKSKPKMTALGQK